MALIIAGEGVERYLGSGYVFASVYVLFGYDVVSSHLFFFQNLKKQKYQIRWLRCELAIIWYLSTTSSPKMCKR